MPTSVCTKRGQNGETDLLFGKRVKKSDCRILLLADIDLLTSYLGLVIACEVPTTVADLLKKLQTDSYTIMTMIATVNSDQQRLSNQKEIKEIIDSQQLQWLEQQIYLLEGKLVVKNNLPLHSNERATGWAVLGTPGKIASSYLDIARAQCRKVEALFWEHLATDFYLPAQRYLNMASDLLWLCSRYLNQPQS